jgi:hypothetical protein
MYSCDSWKQSKVPKTEALFLCVNINVKLHIHSITSYNIHNHNCCLEKKKNHDYNLVVRDIAYNIIYRDYNLKFGTLTLFKR